MPSDQYISDPSLDELPTILQHIRIARVLRSEFVMGHAFLDVTPGLCQTSVLENLNGHFEI